MSHNFHCSLLINALINVKLNRYLLIFAFPTSSGKKKIFVKCTHLLNVYIFMDVYCV